MLISFCPSIKKLFVLAKPTIYKLRAGKSENFVCRNIFDYIKKNLSIFFYTTQQLKVSEKSETKSRGFENFLKGKVVALHVGRHPYYSYSFQY